MLKFFRKIRQQLVKENQMKKYSLYALGEIVLVVLGILIALQFNNWNEGRKDLQKELIVLESLKQEFESNKIELDKRQRGRIKAFASNKKYNELLKSGKFTYAEIVNGEQIVDFGTSNPSYAVLNSLISSGELNLIQPDSLKFKISNWKDFLVDFLENEKIKTNTLIQWLEFKQVHTPGKNWRDYTKEKLEQVYLQEVRKIEYRNRYNSYCGVLNLVINSYPKIEVEMDDILYLINNRIAELKK